MAVDGLSGSTFIAEGFDISGAQIIRVNTAGIQTGLLDSLNASMDEIWKIRFNNCLGQGVILGGGTATPNSQICLLDTNLKTMNPVQLIDTSHIDMSMLTINNSGDCYVVSSTNVVKTNALIKSSITSLSTPDYVNWSSTLTPAELGSVHYVPSTSTYAGTNGFNGIVSTSTNVYTYDGSLLAKWNSATGAFITSKTISATPYLSGGLVADDCGNLFLGNGTTVYQYDSLLNNITSYPLTDTVYCLKVAYNGPIYASGRGFVSSLNPSTGCSDTGCGGELTGINTISYNNSISIYPNPNTGEFTLHIGNNNMVNRRIEIYNTLGQKIYTKALAELNVDSEINVNNQPTGMYLYRVLTESGDLLIEGRFVIQK